MNKKIKIFFVLLITIFFGIENNVNANVDQTNAFSFRYDCQGGQGILKTDFNLGGHHHYYRQYKINKPGIIEIADGNHTTVAKSTNISIDGCGYEPQTCNITNEGSWKYLEGQDEEKYSLNITTNLDIIKDSDNKLLINGSGSEENVEINFENIYTGTGKNLEINLLDNKLELKEFGYDEEGNLTSQVIREINFTNRVLDGKKEFYYQISSDNKIIKLIQRVFKKESSGITNSSENEYDIFSAYDGTNSDEWNLGGCANPNGQSNNGYCTGLDYWDYTQHHYTTTKVKLHRVDLSCTKIEYSNGNTEINSESYEGTLSGIKSPEFIGPTYINNISNGVWGMTLFSTENLKVKGLKYNILGKIGGKILGVKKIELTIKENDITLGKDIFELNLIKNTIGYFPEHTFQIKDDNGDIITKKVGNYQVVFTFFDDNGQQLGTTEIPLTIIPNNNLKKGLLYTSETEVYANGIEKIQLCQDITDEFGNKINKEYSVGNNNINIVDGVINNGNQVLKISDISFKNSKFCFNFNSLAPAKKKLKFKIKVPLHKQNDNLDFNGTYKNFDIETLSEISFKKPLKISEFKTTSGEAPQIGKDLKYNIKLDNIGNVSFFNGITNLAKDKIKNTISGQYWNKFNLLNINIGYIGPDISIPSLSFSGNIDANDNILETPKLKIQGLEVSYKIDGKTVTYNLDDFEYNGVSTCDRETLGVKIIGELQGQGKSSETGQKENISDLTKSDLRGNIRKKAYELIRNRSSDSSKVINGVMYIEGDIKYSNIKDKISKNDTIIIKDGNFVIDEDINENLGVIVLKDNYNMNTDYNNSGNIYINDNVTYIKALIYADGALRSANEDGISYNDSELGNRLELFGSIFTRNTIGGAVHGGTSFTLPGGQEINSFDIAQIYDLNYIRKVPVQCDGSTNDGYSFIIKYNPRNQINPPKGFSD